MKLKYLLAAAILSIATNAAQAGVIAGPVLNVQGGGWVVTGLGFQALTNATLTSFVYQNQGQADSVILTDAAGNILHSLATPASTPSYTANVSWGLTGGNTYYLLQTLLSNELYATFGLPLPSNSDIAITISGTFDSSIAAAVANSQSWGTNQYWAAFNNITTNGGSVQVPEPVTVSIFGAGLAGAATLRKRRKAKV